MAGLTCGNPIFNQLFQDDSAAPVFKVEAFKEIIRDYADRIVSSVEIGIRRDYLKNDTEVRGLAGWWKVNQEQSEVEGPNKQKGDGDSWVQVKIGTPIDAAKAMAKLFPTMNSDLFLYHFRLRCEPKAPLHMPACLLRRAGARTTRACDSRWVWQYVSADRV